MIINTLNQFKAFIIGYMLYLGLNAVSVKALVILMLIDMFTGTVKSIKLERPVTAAIFMLGLMIKICFILLPVTLALAAKGINEDDYKIFVNLSVWILIVNECISIMSNLISIKTAEEVKNFDLIIVFTKFLREQLIKLGMMLMEKVGKKD